MLFGKVVMRLLWTSTSVVQKWTVLPLSAMAMVESRETGGPTSGKVVVNSGLLMGRGGRGLPATSHEPSGAALHVAGSGRVLVSLTFVLARTTGVDPVLVETVGSAVKEQNVASWDDVGTRNGVGSARRGDNGGAVGTVIVSVLGSELARALFVGLSEGSPEIDHGPLNLRLVAPLLGGSGEHASSFKDDKSEAKRSSIGGGLVSIFGEALNLLDAIPQIFD